MACFYCLLWGNAYAQIIRNGKGEVLAPTEGKIFDPACGSGGMFVQTAHCIERHKEKGKQMNLRAFGVEKTAATIKLAKMSLVLNNVRGTITHANSYARDPYNSFGAFDYVMANHPFNVNDVEVEIVKDQPRFNTYGIPQNKTKKSKKDAKKLFLMQTTFGLISLQQLLMKTDELPLLWQTRHLMQETAKRKSDKDLLKAVLTSKW